MNTTRQHLNETIRRLAKPKVNPMTQSIHIGATTGPGSSNGMPLSRSSHQLRLTTSTTTTTVRKVCFYAKIDVKNAFFLLICSDNLLVQRLYQLPLMNLELLRRQTMFLDLNKPQHTSQFQIVLQLKQNCHLRQPKLFLILHLNLVLPLNDLL